jgi:NAD(P)-dependent dehydrogenase (short-subunit alcohol dehydrogenase family)
LAETRNVYGTAVPFEAFDLSGKTALVTGGNRGLGLGFATGVAKAGADVVIWGRRADNNEEAAAGLRKHGVRVLAQPVDVADEQQVGSALSEALGEVGKIDCVFANAGISTRAPSFHGMSSEMWHELLAVNLHGAFYTLRAAVGHMVERAEAGDPGGSVVVCGSLLVFSGVPRLQHYGAAKGALVSVTRSIAVEYGRHGIRANMIAPGWFESGLGGRDPDVVALRDEQIRLRNPIPRAGTPADLEGIAVYLMSDASSYHTGDVIVIDGGKLIAI